MWHSALETLNAVQVREGEFLVAGNIQGVCVRALEKGVVALETGRVCGIPHWSLSVML